MQIYVGIPIVFYRILKGLNAVNTINLISLWCGPEERFPEHSDEPVYPITHSRE